MTMVTIGVDPHKGSHTAVAVDRDENEVEGLLRVARERAFDADSYRIIGRCLKTLRSRDIIVFDRPETHNKNYMTATP